MITREEALILLKKYLHDEKLLKHSLAVESIMRSLAKKLGQSEELWGLVGLLHDLDYEYTRETPHLHAIMSTKILEGLLPREGLNAIKAHNYIHTQYLPVTDIDKGLLAADAVSGLIIATALVMPNKKLSEVTTKTLYSKYKDKSFAKKCDRNKIILCQDLNINLEDFLYLSLNALKDISTELGL